MKQKYQLIYPDQVISLEMTIFRLRLKLWALCLITPILSFGGVVIHSTHPKLSWLFPPAGVVASVYGLSLLKTLEREQGLLEALPDYCVASRSQRFKEFLAPGNVLASELVGVGEDAGETFQPQTLTPNLIKSFPHILVWAPTGWGKTTICNHILNQIDGDIIVFDPHSEPNQWGDLPVFSSYSDIAQIMVASQKEMVRRYGLRRQGQKDWQPLTIVVDEFPAVASSDPCSEKWPGDKKGRSIFRYWFQSLTCEARKVDIKILALTQGKSIKSTGLEGQSELLENLALIRGGEFAKQHAKSLKDDLLSQWIKSQKRPAILNDDPLIIPDLSNEKLRHRKPISDDNLAWISNNNRGDDHHHDTTPTTTNHHDRETLERLYRLNPTTNHHNHHHHHNDSINLDKVHLTPPPQSPPLTCPSCLSDDLIKHSRTSSGRDRKRCKSCGKIFSV